MYKTSRNRKNSKSKIWRIGIENPSILNNSRDIMATVKLDNLSLATSGNYRKYFIKDGELYAHTINPKTGKAIPSNILSVSVLAENCMKADAYATALMVMPLQQAKVLIEKQPSLEAYWILSDSLGKVKEIFLIICRN